ncbi:MAG: cytochrome-c peroxidase, partial [Gammaproteobacteria bacterium]|nr:cytochrome-c peroxidase [Gammaproteobacteria bacterium]
MKTSAKLLALLTLVVPTAASASASDDLAALGRALYFDGNLSYNRTQSCASCHAPDRAFVDPRGAGELAAASLGDDGRSIGDRNAPSAAYARFSP